MWLYEGVGEAIVEMLLEREGERKYVGRTALARRLRDGSEAVVVVTAVDIIGREGRCAPAFGPEMLNWWESLISHSIQLRSARTVFLLAGPYTSWTWLVIRLASYH